MPNVPAQTRGGPPVAHWADVACGLRDLAQSTLGDGGRVVPPAATEFSYADRASIYLAVLEAVYFGAHRRSALTREEVVRLQADGRLRVWVVMLGDDPVGVVTIATGGGVANLGVVAKLPPGTRLPSGRIFSGQLRAGAAVWRAVADVLSDPVLLSGVWCLSTETRLAAERGLPDGRMVPTGARVHGVIDRTGFVPFLYSAPYPNRQWSEFFLWSRLYLMPEAVDQGPLYFPAELGGGLLRRLATTSYCRAWGRTPPLGVGAGAAGPPSVSRSEAFGDGVITLVFDGDVGPREVQEAVSAALSERPFCMVATVNRVGNVRLHREFDRLGLIPLGVWPGGEFSTSTGVFTPPTLLVYATGRPEAIASATPVALGRAYADAEVGPLVLALYAQWKELATQGGPPT